MQTGTTSSEETSTQNVVIPASGSAPDLTVYSTDSGVYYGVGTDTETDEIVYYTVTESNGTYTVGDQITVTETTVYTDTASGETGDVPTGSDTDSGITLTLTSEDKTDTTYTLMAAVTGDTKTPGATDDEETRLASVSDITYYWVSGKTIYTYTSDSAVGDKVSALEDTSNLYY
ncbi:MAG: hypothetical protein LUC27_02650, partial [Lachnospiraceae bacterium]|nr:hypothetical protein [Lachnospiraceae bacterium]